MPGAVANPGRSGPEWGHGRRPQHPPGGRRRPAPGPRRPGGRPLARLRPAGQHPQRLERGLDVPHRRRRRPGRALPGRRDRPRPRARTSRRPPWAPPRPCPGTTGRTPLPARAVFAPAVCPWSSWNRRPAPSTGRRPSCRSPIASWSGTRSTASRPDCWRWPTWWWRSRCSAAKRSLNVAVSFGVLAYEVRRQWTADRLSGGRRVSFASPWQRSGYVRLVAARRRLLRPFGRAEARADRLAGAPTRTGAWRATWPARRRGASC